jgi:hypothetical protein
MITTAARPFVIPAPRLGLLNLMDDDGCLLQAEDERAFGALFDTTTRSSRVPPECDVLVAYLKLREDGGVVDCNETLEQIVWTAGAPITMIGAPNSGDAYIKATRWFGSSSAVHGGSVNLVMTLDRHGELFGQFFSKLFSKMKEGETMPMAWVTLAPQNPHAQQEAPETIFACGAGHIAFAQRPSFLKRVFGRKTLS